MKSKAFSLVEIIITVFIVGVALTAAVLLIASSFRTSVSVKNLLIASHLAQEGIELARNIRDGNWLDPLAPSWSDGLQNTGAQKCTPLDKSWCPFLGNIDITMDALANIRYVANHDIYTPGDIDRVYFRQADSRYLHSISCGAGECTPTRFYRYLVLKYEDDPGTAQPYLSFKSVVKWVERGSWKKIEADEKLYNWK